MLNAEGGGIQSHVAAHDAGQLDVADLLIARVLPLDPVLLYGRGLEAKLDGHRGDGTGVVGLDTTDGDESVSTLSESLSGEVPGREKSEADRSELCSSIDLLKLSDLVAASCQSGIAILRAC